MTHDTELCADPSVCNSRVVRYDLCGPHSNSKRNRPPKFSRKKRSATGNHSLSNIRDGVADCYECGPGVETHARLGSYRCARGNKASQRMFRYGVSQEWYDLRLIALGNRCALCGDAPGQLGLVVDHCHETGKVRDLVCDRCNLMLGQAKDRPDVLRRGIDYLERRS